MRALGAAGDAAGFDDVTEEAQIGEVEADHPAKPSVKGKCSFEFGEGSLRQIPIVSQVLARHIRQ
jgi:hypothetical protein